MNLFYAEEPLLCIIKNIILDFMLTSVTVKGERSCTVVMINGEQMNN